MLIIKLPQDQYSELVVRKSLYWVSSELEWILEQHEKHWVVCIKNPIDSSESSLHKYLNDFLLREKLDMKTRALREELIHASLRAVILNVNHS